VFAVMAATRRHTYQILTKRHGRMRSLLTTDGFADRVLDLSEEIVPTPMGELPHGDTWPLPNVWLGVSVEDQHAADLRIPALLETPAAVRFLSCEPLVGPVDLSRWLGRRIFHSSEDFETYLDGLVEHGAPASVEWVIVGGESGSLARPMHPAWARGLRDQCTQAGVPFFFKQWGVYRPGGDATRPAVWVDPYGQPGPFDGSGRQVAMVRVGKHAAGRDLDGRTWNEFPQMITAVTALSTCEGGVA
jgi:protein gp37